MRVIATRKGLQVRYTDHLSLEVYVCDLPSSQLKVETKSKWNLMKPGGWEKYAEATNDIAAIGGGQEEPGAPLHLEEYHPDD